MEGYSCRPMTITYFIKLAEIFFFLFLTIKPEIGRGNAIAIESLFSMMIVGRSKQFHWSEWVPNSSQTESLSQSGYDDGVCLNRIVALTMDYLPLLLICFNNTRIMLKAQGPSNWLL